MRAKIIVDPWFDGPNFAKKGFSLELIPENELDKKNCRELFRGSPATRGAMNLSLSDEKDDKGEVTGLQIHFSIEKDCNLT